MVAVVEKGHVPASAETLQELEQRTRALWELEAEHAFVGRFGSTTDHIPGVGFGHLILTDIPGLHVLVRQLLHDHGYFTASVRAQERHEDLGLAAVGVPVRELGDHQRVDMVVEFQERTGLLWDNDTEQSFLLLTEQGTLGHKAQTLKVHVGARGDGNAGLVCQLVFPKPLLAPSHSESSCRFDDRTGVFENVLYGGTDLSQRKYKTLIFLIVLVFFMCS